MKTNNGNGRYESSLFMIEVGYFILICPVSLFHELRGHKVATKTTKK